MPSRRSPRRKDPLEKALHERLQRLTERLDTADIAEKSIDIVKEIKELHALSRALAQEGRHEEDTARSPAPLRIVWAGEGGENPPPESPAA